MQFSNLTMSKVKFVQSTAGLPTLFVGLCVSGLTLNLLSGVPARALTVTEAFFPVRIADGGSDAAGLAISGLGASVGSVSLSVTLTKCGAIISGSGVCSDVSLESYSNEIQLWLKSPTGISAQVVFQDDISPTAPGATVTWNFQDSFSPATLVGSSSLQSGSYQPGEAFSLFNGANPNGTWNLIYEDTSRGAPLSINSWILSVTDSSTPDPGPADVPGPLPLFGVAAAFGWSRLLRKRIRARRDLRPGS